MKNPWEEIPLTDYENHMQLASVMQLQAMSEMMKGQFDACPASDVMILGIAGGNGLAHIPKGKFKSVYGVDINADYLRETHRRYPELNGILECLRIDLTDETETQRLPHAELLLANLVIEYIGYECFQRTVRQAAPRYVSCIIQVNIGETWVSDSPYLHAFDGLESVHCQIDEKGLEQAMLEIGFSAVKTLEHKLPNGKKLVQMDFKFSKSKTPQQADGASNLQRSRAAGY
ncbi:MAG: class I SAM-dependent methyltransferase [Roseburia sp.]|nr:class I SAM-dependent methyltransferase [Roseburia sp.]